MNSSEYTKLAGVAMSFGSIVDYLSNVEARAPKAVRSWAPEADRFGRTDPAKKKRMKDCIATAGDLKKDAKKVKADLNGFIKGTKDKAKVAQYMTAKDYCVAIAPKHLASTKKFDGDAMKFTLALYKVLDGGGPKLFPGMGDAEIRGLMSALSGFNQTYTLVRTEIATL